MPFILSKEEYKAGRKKTQSGMGFFFCFLTVSCYTSKDRKGKKRTAGILLTETWAQSALLADCHNHSGLLTVDLGS